MGSGVVLASTLERREGGGDSEEVEAGWHDAAVVDAGEATLSSSVDC